MRKLLALALFTTLLGGCALLPPPRRDDWSRDQPPPRVPAVHGDQQGAGGPLAPGSNDPRSTGAERPRPPDQLF